MSISDLEHLIDQGRYAEALQMADAVVAAGPDARALWLRARVRAHHGQMDEALADCDRAISLDGCLVGAYRTRSRLLAKGQPDRAWEDANQAVALEPEAGLNWASRGLLQLERQRFEAAETDLVEGTRRSPHDLECWKALSQVYLAQDRHEAAAQTMSEIIRLFPQYSSAWFCRGVMLREMGRLEEAVEHIERAFELNPDASRKDVEKSLDIAPDDPMMLEFRARYLGDDRPEPAS